MRKGLLDDDGSGWQGAPYSRRIGQAGASFFFKTSDFVKIKVEGGGGVTMKNDSRPDIHKKKSFQQVVLLPLS